MSKTTTVAFPVKLNDEYTCQGKDARGDFVTFEDLLAVGQRVYAESDGEGNHWGPAGIVVRKADGLWVENEANVTQCEQCERPCVGEDGWVHDREGNSFCPECAASLHDELLRMIDVLPARIGLCPDPNDSAEFYYPFRNGEGLGCPNCSLDMVVYLKLPELDAEIRRQDVKYGPFEGTRLGRSRLAIACVEDELDEVRKAWRDDRETGDWAHTRTELVQVMAVAFRALRDAF